LDKRNFLAQKTSYINRKFNAKKGNTMNSNSGPSASDTIDAYRKRQQRGPFIIWAIAGLLVLIGIIILIVWLAGDKKPEIDIPFLATETPTATLTSTPTITPSPTFTGTATLTPTQTVTPVPPTPSAPFSYTVQEGESLVVIADKFGLGENGILLLLALNPAVETRGFVYVGEEILIPNPDMELPTATSVPVDLRPGTELEYTIRPGDTIAGIANRFRSTSDAILELNNIENANTIQAGQVILIPVNLVTAEPTRLPPTAPANLTPTPTQVSGLPPAGGTCDYQQNEEYVAQIFELVNSERVTQGLSPLTMNEKLNKAALVHASDMVCNGIYKEEGSDGSTPAKRVERQGYIASIVLQEIHSQAPEYGGDGQAAFKAWMDGTTLLNPNVTEIGIAYAYSPNSAFGGYFTVLLAAP